MKLKSTLFLTQFLLSMTVSAAVAQYNTQPQTQKNPEVANIASARLPSFAVPLPVPAAGIPISRTLMSPPQTRLKLKLSTQNTRARTANTARASAKAKSNATNASLTAKQPPHGQQSTGQTGQIKPKAKRTKAAAKEAALKLLVSTKIIDHAYAETDNEDDKWIALSFDDGPSPEYTPQILALLKEHKIHATFCVVGRQVKKCPDLIKQIAAEGHKIASHSMNHDESLSWRPNKKIKQEILGEKILLESIVPEIKIEYYRAPAGNWNLKVRRLAASWGLKPLGWSVDTKDWQKPGTDTIISNIEKHVKAGSLILMHDGGGDRSETVSALKKIIPELKAEGYKFGFPQ